MIKIYIFVDSYKHFENSIKEYEKRLGKDIELIKIKPSKKTDSNSIIIDETNLLKEKLKKEKAYKVVLNPNGKSFQTETFLDFVERKKLNYGNLVFCVGGAYGFDYKLLKSSIDFEMKLGDFTMPHSLALLVLLEQIYRIQMMKKGTSYHK
ncbi:hypothetical protein CSA08_01680 [Candidatus Gracilibacteria bacterium]|nr:MAG: hypothetical protein CSA08_01680 [Candidatus Gracilibacteria bacterium]